MMLSMDDVPATLLSPPAIVVRAGKSIESDPIDFPNAYNAPHWMNIYSSFNIPFAGSTTRYRDGTDVTEENYATSWMRDLIKAWEISHQQQGLTSGRLQINGLTDPTHLYTTHNRGSHSVGMGLDLGVGQYINSFNQTHTNNNGAALSIAGNGWSVSNAIAWSNMLPTGAGYNQAGALKNFLSIYALTQNDGITGNGTWDDLTVQNGDKVREALFGSGSQNDNVMIQNVWIGGRETGQNQYPNIRYVLSKLGFTNNQYSYSSLPHTYTMGDHHNHFHIDLRPPTRVAINAPDNLLADNTAVDSVFVSNQAGDANDPSQMALQALLEQAQSELNLEGDVSMFILDMPPASPQSAPVMIAQANQAQMGTNMIDRAVGVCHIVPNGANSLENTIEPVGEAREYFRLYEHRTAAGQAQVTILQNPKHGILRLVTEADRGTLFDSSADLVNRADGLYVYLPEKGYLGKDQATVLVEIGGFKVKVAYFFQAINGVAIGNTTYDRLCGKNGYSWKISRASEILNPQSEIEQITQDNNALAQWLPSAGTFNYLSGASSVTYTFTNLPGTSVGQTTGEGSSASIFLDTNAAGHGWFTDSTPLDNEEFMPTSNPNEWVAKEGTDAADKMDLLSVLLHEYGHALGLEHSADTHDFMGASLQPGAPLAQP